MPRPALSRKTLEELERRHIAFLEQRLISDAARRDWLRACREGYERLRQARVRDVAEPAVLGRALQNALSSDSARTFFAPIAAEMYRRVLAGLRENTSALGGYVPADARAAIDALLERRDLIPDALVRKLFEQPVIEEAIHDTLYEALTQFMKTVNPFFAEWGLPAILKRMPIGGSMILASMEAMRGEFDRRLEPEIRRFLTAFAHGSRSQLADLFLARSADPKLIELRKNLVAFLYTQSVGELLAGVDAQTVEQSGAAVQHVILAAIERGRVGRGGQQALGRFVEELGDATVGEWLDSIGAAGDPDVEAWAELAWPHVASVLTSTPVRDLLRKLTAEFYAELGSDPV